MEVEEFIQHFGKRGMKWGSKKGATAAKQHVSRKQKRQQEKHNKRQEAQKKANMFLNTALKDPQVLINLNGRVIVTGREFTNHLISGGLLDVKRTTIYAQQKNGKGAYVIK